MNTGYFKSAIGKQSDTKEVKALLKNFDIDGRVVINRNETDAYKSNAGVSVSLLFESERYISSKHGVELPSDAPVLTAIFLYGPGDDEFSEYKGDLSGGVLFTDSRELVMQKLGVSTKFNPDRNSEFWDLENNVRLFVRYAEDGKFIERVQFGILWR